MARREPATSVKYEDVLQIARNKVRDVSRTAGIGSRSEVSPPLHLNHDRPVRHPACWMAPFRYKRSLLDRAPICGWHCPPLVLGAYALFPTALLPALLHSSGPGVSSIAAASADNLRASDHLLGLGENLDRDETVTSPLRSVNVIHCLNFAADMTQAPQNFFLRDALHCKAMTLFRNLE